MLKNNYYKHIYIFIIILLFGISPGFNFAISNQNTYLIQGLRWFDSSILSNDWFASNTTHYHHFFSYIVYFLYSIDQSGWAFVAANILALMLILYLIYLILLIMFRKKYLIVLFSLLVSLMIFGGTLSVSGSYLISGYLQPSTFGTIGLLGAYLFFLKKKYLLSGLFIGLGGLFHANFLVLSFPLFFIALLFLNRKDFLKNCFFLFIFPIIALIPQIPIVLSTAFSPFGEEARRIFLEVLHPHHYVPLFFWKEFIIFFCWVIIGYFVGWKSLSNDSPHAEFKALLYSSFIIIIGGTLLTTVIFIPSVSQLYVWRLAPFFILQLQIIICFCISKIIENFDRTYLKDWKFIILVLGCFAFICIYTIKVDSQSSSIGSIFNAAYHYPHFLKIVAMMLIIGMILLPNIIKYLNINSLKLKRVMKITAFVVLALTLFKPLVHINARSSLLTEKLDNEFSLYSWIKDNTEKNAVFLVPLDMKNFRLNAQRAIIVDWKSPPIVPEEVMEWCERVKDITGQSQITNLDDANEKFSSLVKEDIDKLVNKYSIEYITIYKDKNYKFSDSFNKIFENDKFIILKI